MSKQDVELFFLQCFL